MPRAGVNSRRIAVAALGVAALGMGGATELLASAQVQPHMSIKVKREVGRDVFTGRIKAKDNACTAKRKVKLVIRKPNRDKIRPGSTKTNGKGRWKFIPPRNRESDQYAAEGSRYAHPGEWRAKVREENVGGVRCAAGKTSPIHVG
jgi:hypothetical protein